MYLIIKLVNILHLIIIITSIVSIIIPIIIVKKYALIFLIFILFHYLTNNQKCGLTELEYYLLKKKYNEGFIFKLIKPIITIPEHYFNKYLYLLHILWILILYYQIYDINNV
jgi:hypothetical protein|uniref:DUF2784 family protein n=1 Tax=viral metagenome TaxID=1070528 RepID=A0A6C0EEC0_9ZZZZ